MYCSIGTGFNIICKQIIIIENVLSHLGTKFIKYIPIKIPKIMLKLKKSQLFFVIRMN